MISLMAPQSLLTSTFGWSAVLEDREPGVVVSSVVVPSDAARASTVPLLTFGVADEATRGALLAAVRLQSISGDIAAGNAQWTPQDNTRASEAPKLTKADRVIRWNQPAEAIAAV